jgi:hypothetical protein
MGNFECETVAREVQELTGSQEIESISDVALVADEQESTLLVLGRLLRSLLRGRHIFTIRNSTTDNDSVVVLQVGTGSHLTDVSREWTLLVLFDGLEIEVVG